MVATYGGKNEHSTLGPVENGESDDAILSGLRTHEPLELFVFGSEGNATSGVCMGDASRRVPIKSAFESFRR